MGECNMEVMKRMSVYYCRKCGTLDYADGACPKCGNKDIVRAEEDFLTGYVMNLQMKHSSYLYENNNRIK